MEIASWLMVFLVFFDFHVFLVFFIFFLDLHLLMAVCELFSTDFLYITPLSMAYGFRVEMSKADHLLLSP